MTLQELWKLFPIELCPYSPSRITVAKEEMRKLEKLLADFSPTINHIGSTAIPGIYAKPIVDILIEVSPGADAERLRDTMESTGYICMSTGDTRMSFNKGYTPDGYAKDVFHIHVHYRGDCDEIIFRDYLISHPEIAKEYEALKLSLLPRYRNDRDGYTNAKSEFVKRIMELRAKE
ncbi:MAG: GrpB family protein [Muribaculaceae bacterium]|nr:GrpB family protein [Muribaculaceae bacterium]